MRKLYQKLHLFHLAVVKDRTLPRLDRVKSHMAKITYTKKRMPRNISISDSSRPPYESMMCPRT